VGELVLLHVSGKIKEDLSLIEFYTSQTGARHNFFETGPISFTERVRNNGSLHEKPIGSVEVHDLFGRKIVSLPINEPPHNVLPASIRRFDQQWGSKWLLGPYSATATLHYGSGQTLVGAVVFWVIPWRLILIVLLLLVVLIWLVRQSVRRYNRRVIERAKRGGGI
jgi:hypothetical protein